MSSKLLKELSRLNEFVRSLEDFAAKNDISIRDDRIYVAAKAQRDLLREMVKI